ncbi:transmembrane protein 59-like [Limosa lapponica baueri]|uniref:Transmembrane protein 59-like n=1 Tax=Limosa lapponica baueri TaxID=1758121 RepID=A0A2I0T6C5_LIMLA|nr:transmembrane protein 59-like [Limosa lapponica baueri]
MCSPLGLEDAVLNACYRGCRLFSICHFVDASAELNTTRAECEAGEEPAAEWPLRPKHHPGGSPTYQQHHRNHPASAQPHALPQGRIQTLLQTKWGADLCPQGHALKPTAMQRSSLAA